MGRNGQRRVREFLWPAVTYRYLSVYYSANGDGATVGRVAPAPEPVGVRVGA
jgi:hypothetical protein